MTASESTTEFSAVTLHDGDTLHVCQDGPREAPALLLIHGSASSVRSWDALVPLLTRNGARAHRVVRVDLLGHGRSDKPDDGSYAIPDQARRVGEVLDRLGVGRAVVVGHSSGGVTATAPAERRPELVSALVLVNTGPGLGAFTGPDAQGSAGPVRWPPDDEQIRQLASTGFSRPGYRVPDALLDEVRAMTAHSFAATMRGTLAYMSERALPERLAVLGKPLLVLFGADDRRWRSSSAADYRVVPGSRVELLAGLGHSPILEDPPQVAGPLLDFAALHG
ncbi:MULTISPECIES: alpha/beta fold hydrolase [unclassified Streptomyces]|uniref:alpha/beta fold hydrolase n=1 Tax=unclassified Streptomyces TaxID=2593676 RepID=UPI000DAD7B4C|nr:MULTISPECIES: alpha/beta hydrolase [unclassified Streptomyces]PZT71715.1 alpha/beta hydrolase [Streptomyces sp. AC1-42T]PZT73158.1 alpha/beta hydrolase [Streptomyces sp. AC1-42W]